ncbi:hypothetical protein, partial [Pseudomonas syringae group genomosp. 7]
YRDAGLWQILVGQTHPVQRIVFEQGGLLGQLHQQLAFAAALAGVLLVMLVSLALIVIGSSWG